ncbi:MAG: hypothetical protein M1522_05965 [Actinobacteria bacterium]|nr:hypothetical protein [Actinomycetota bacterium]
MRRPLRSMPPSGLLAGKRYPLAAERRARLSRLRPTASSERRPVPGAGDTSTLAAVRALL